jgi:hypothetical protein
VDPSKSYCSGSEEALPTSWTSVALFGAEVGTDFTSATVKVTDITGAVVNGLDGVSIDSFVSLAGIPVSGDTARLTFTITFTDPAADLYTRDPSVAIDVRWESNAAVEVCLSADTVIVTPPPSTVPTTSPTTTTTTTTTTIDGFNCKQHITGMIRVFKNRCPTGWRAV